MNTSAVAERLGVLDSTLAPARAALAAADDRARRDGYRDHEHRLDGIHARARRIAAARFGARGQTRLARLARRSLSALGHWDQHVAETADAVMDAVVADCDSAPPGPIPRDATTLPDATTAVVLADAIPRHAPPARALPTYSYFEGRAAA